MEFSRPNAETLRLLQAAQHLRVIGVDIHHQRFVGQAKTGAQKSRLVGLGHRLGSAMLAMTTVTGGRRCGVGLDRMLTGCHPGKARTFIHPLRGHHRMQCPAIRCSVARSVNQLVKGAGFFKHLHLVQMGIQRRLDLRCEHIQSARDGRHHSKRAGDQGGPKVDAPHQAAALGTPVGLSLDGVQWC